MNARFKAEAGSPLVRRLELVRARWVVRSLFRGLAWTVLATAIASMAIVLFVVAELGPSRPMISSLAIVPAACAFAGAVLTLVRVTVGRPDLVEVARWAEGRFALQERLSTALEESARGSRGALTAALWSDAERHVEVVAPRAVIPLRPTPPYVTLWILAITAFAACLMLPGRAPVPLDASAPQGRGESTSAQGDFSETAAKLRRVTELVALDPGRAEDPRLQGFMRDVARLESSLTAGGADARSIGAELDRLLTEAAQIFGGPPGSDGAGSDSGQSYAEETAPRGAGEGAADFVSNRDGNSTAVDAHLRAEEGELGTGAAAPPAPEEERLTLDLLLERLATDFSTEAKPAPEGTESATMRAAQGPVEQLEWEDESATNAILENLQRMRANQARQEGTFADRPDMAGDGTAGRATQAPDEGAAAAIGAGEARPRDEIVLPTERVAERGTITLEAPPDVREALVAMPPGSVGDWRPATESVQAGEAISWRHRAAVRNYFLPDIAVEEANR